MDKVNLMLGDCLDKLKELDDNSVDSIVTDPPYGLSFMGKAWDKSVPSIDVWEECLRVLKPGGHLLAFAGTRTQHRMAVNIEDAGFEIRDMIAWVYGSGFPKSQNISKAIDKMYGAEREVVGVAGKSGSVRNSMAGDFAGGEYMETKSATDDAIKYDGWGTALKPALEPITVARKPISEKTVAANVLKYGTGGINIDESRVSYNEYNKPIPQLAQGKTKVNSSKTMFDGQSLNKSKTEAVIGGSLEGRFPANLIHDGSEEVVELFPNTKSGNLTPDQQKNGGYAGKNENGIYGKSERGGLGSYNSNEGSAARFFYCAKTSKKDRNDGVEKNNHPTVKPTELMKYLVRMVTPKGGTVLDPFMGSGSTGKAAKLEGFNFIGVELDADYMKIAKARIDAAEKEMNLEEFFNDN